MLQTVSSGRQQLVTSLRVFLRVLRVFAVCITMPSLLIQNGTILDPLASLNGRATCSSSTARSPRSAMIVGKADRTIDASRLLRHARADRHSRPLPRARGRGGRDDRLRRGGRGGGRVHDRLLHAEHEAGARQRGGRSSSSSARRERVGLANVCPIGAITKGREGKELAEIGSMHRARRGRVQRRRRRRGRRRRSCARRCSTAKMFDALIMQHCEEPTLARRRDARRAGLASSSACRGMPAEAEQLMIARDVLLNRTIGCRYHVQHISTAWQRRTDPPGKARRPAPSRPRSRRTTCC